VSVDKTVKAHMILFLFLRLISELESSISKKQQQNTAVDMKRYLIKSGYSRDCIRIVEF